MMEQYKGFKILVIDDEEEYREVLENIFNLNGYEVDTAESGETGLKMLEKYSYNLVVTDLIMTGMNGLEFLNKSKELYPEIEVLIVTGYGTVENAVEAMRKGAFGYFVKSHDPEELIMEIKKIERISDLEKNNSLLKIQQNSSGYLLDSKNRAFNHILEIARKVAINDTNVLILGESGVGKEVLARYIHQCSEREHEPFVSINCSSFPDTLVEAELYGYEKGAFTGAASSRKGRFEAADNGILFIDELGDIPLNIQVKLLQNIENKEIQRIGSNKNIKVNFKLIAATNRNLREAISDGNFREDLFYRISTIIIEIPPLRKRKEDLASLIRFFIQKAENDLNKKVRDMEPVLLDFLMNYHYPGNLREMKNILERLVVLADSDVLRSSDLPEYCVAAGEGSIVKKKGEKGIFHIRPLKEVRKEFESDYIKNALENCGWNISATARKLDMSRRQLTNKINDYNL
jgi:DNA-binding NtrC family response regulator